MKTQSNTSYINLSEAKNPAYFRLQTQNLIPASPGKISELKHKKILVYVSPGIGDAIIATAAIKSLKKSVPSCHVTLLTSASACQIAPLVPEIDNTIGFDTPWDKQANLIDSRNVLQMVDQLKNRFDVGIVLTKFSQTAYPAALIMYLANIPRRIAYSHTKPYQLLTDWIPDPEPAQFIRHQVVRDYRLLETIGVNSGFQQLSLTVPKAVLEQTKLKIGELGLKNAKTIIIHPSSTDWKRTYSNEGFAEIGKLLVDKGYNVVFTGTNSEKGQIESYIKQAKGTINAAGKLTLPELAAFIKLADGVVTINTSVSHIAAALKIPEVVFYAKTNPQDTPWMAKDRTFFFNVPSPLEENNSHLQILPADVIKILAELLVRTE